MRISLGKRVVFLSNPRCGSGSIRTMLDPWSDIKGAKGGPVHRHACLRSVERYLAETGAPPLKEFSIFTTVRNPWARVVSIYHFGLRKPRSIWHAPAVASGSVAAFAHHEILDWVFGPNAGHPEGPFDILSFTKTERGENPAAVFDVASMEAVGKHLAERGIEVETKHINRTRHAHYAEYFDARSRDRVSDLFRADIELMGYVF